MNNFNYEYLRVLKNQNSALKLMRSANFQFAASFLHQVFIFKNRHSISYSELIHQLEYFLMDIKDIYGPDLYPAPAKEYIDEWINEKPGYLRKYLPVDSDEAECDILPDVEKALRWLEDLQGREFVGTESRLKMVFDLIGDLTQGTTESNEDKIVRLEKERDKINQEIIKVKQGKSEGLNKTQIKEKLFLITDTSQRLIGDFRQIESNFRDLDRGTRKKISLSSKNKGDLLDEILVDQDTIDESDEGRSFSAFFEMLMTPSMKEKLSGDLRILLELPEAKEIFESSSLLSNMYKHLLDSGSRVNQTKSLITEQLSRYIQEQSYENRLVSNLIRETESLLHHFESFPDIKTSIMGDSVEINSVMSLKPYSPKEKEDIQSEFIEAENEDDVDLTPLLSHTAVDEEDLISNIILCLKESDGQVNITEITNKFPIEHGLEEALLYFKIAKENIIKAAVNEEDIVKLDWNNNGNLQTLELPNIIFTRN